MDTSAILASLRTERDRIGKAIEALEALDRGGARAGSRGSRPRAAAASGKAIRRRKPLTPAARKHLSEMMRKRWAERKRKQKAS
jgi:hypothetical protein